MWKMYKSSSRPTPETASFGVRHCHASPRNAGILYVLLCVCPSAFDVTPLRLSPTYVLGNTDALESSASQVLDDCLSSIVRQGLSNGLDDFLLDFGQTSTTVHLEDIPALFLHVRLF